MSDPNQNAVPGAVNPVTPVVTPAAQAAPPVGVAPVPPAVEAPKVKAAPRPLNPYAAKVAAKAQPVADPRIAALEASNAEHLSTISSYASAEMESTPENVRAAVLAIAGDNPAAQLKALKALRANGVGVATLTPGATTGAGAKPTAASQKPAPKAAPAESPESQALAHYRHLQKKGAPLLAAQFRSRNAEAINKAEAAEASN